MNKANSSFNKKKQEVLLSTILSFVFLAFGIFFLYLYLEINSIDREGYLVGTILCFVIGGFTLIMNIKGLIKLEGIKRKMEVLKNTGEIIRAKVIDEKHTILEGNQLICNAEINGTSYEFISSSVPRYSLYACKELGIDELPVYVNMQNPKEYAVDTEEVEDRIVDLT